MNDDKLLKMMGITQKEISEALGNQPQPPNLIPNMSKAYFSQVDKASMLSLLEEGFMFNYADPKSKSSSGHTNDTSVRLGLLDGDVKAVVMTYKMNIPLSEVVSLKEKGISYDELYLMGELNS